MERDPRAFPGRARAVLLTAVHFHFAGFGCLLIVGLLGRLLWSHRTWAPRAWRLHPVVAVGLMGAFPLLAAGIAGQRALEVLGVSLYVLLLPLLAGLLLVGATRVDSGLRGARRARQGVYLAHRLLALRLPLNETIWVWSAEGTPHTEPPCDDPAVVLRARHEMWFFGRKYLELHYSIERLAEAGPE